MTRALKGFASHFASHGVGSATARALGMLSAQVQREANVLAYIDGFWLCFWLAMPGLGFVAFITRAPQGPFTPAPFGFAKTLITALRPVRVLVPQKWAPVFRKIILKQKDRAG